MPQLLHYLKVDSKTTLGSSSAQSVATAVADGAEASAIRFQNAQQEVLLHDLLCIVLYDSPNKLNEHVFVYVGH